MKKILITGNVGRDPDVRVDQSGNNFATFSVAVSVGTKKPKTDWVQVSCTGKLSEIARNYIKKGSKLLVEGFPTVNVYLDKQNKPTGTLVVYANNIEFLGGSESKEPSNDNSAYVLPEVTDQQTSKDLYNDVPF